MLSSILTLVNLNDDLQTEVLRNDPQKLEEVDPLDDSNHSANAQFDKNDIGFSSCSFSWDPFTDSIERRLGRDQFFLRFESELKFTQGSTTLIVGPTGSGKVIFPY